MILVIIETLIVKGLYTIVHGIIAHGATASTVHAGMMVAHSVTTYGIAQTVSSLAGAGLVVGGISWTAERVNTLANAVEAIENKDYYSAAKHCASLCNSLNTHIEYLPDVVESFLTRGGISPEKVSHIKETIESMEGSIIQQLR
jgi:hypothetical protein